MAQPVRLYEAETTGNRLLEHMYAYCSALLCCLCCTVRRRLQSGRAFPNDVQEAQIQLADFALSTKQSVTDSPESEDARGDRDPL